MILCEKIDDCCWRYVHDIRHLITIANLPLDNRIEIKQFFDIFYNSEEEIINTLEKNNHQQLARVRINFFREDGELFDANNHEVNFLIQSFDLNETSNQLNINGLMVDIFYDAVKSCDSFSNFKTNNYLPYAMAAIWAKENKLNDALLLNSNNHIADSCIANVFIITDKTIFTPRLNDGCIDGVMRKNIIQKLLQKNIQVIEKNIRVDDILDADEMFLTNAIKGINWVKKCSYKSYQNTKTQELYQMIFAT